jgi:hypothetical protein
LLETRWQRRRIAGARSKDFAADGSADSGTPRTARERFERAAGAGARWRYTADTADVFPAREVLAAGSADSTAAISGITARTRSRSSVTLAATSGITTGPRPHPALAAAAVSGITTGPRSRRPALTAAAISGKAARTGACRGIERRVERARVERD